MDPNEINYFHDYFTRFLSEHSQTLQKPYHFFPRSKYILRLYSNQLKVYSQSSHVECMFDREIVTRFFTLTAVPNYLYVPLSASTLVANGYLMRTFAGTPIKYKQIITFDAENKRYECQKFLGNYLFTSYIHYSKKFAIQIANLHAYNILKNIVPFLIIESNFPLQPNFNSFLQTFQTMIKTHHANLIPSLKAEKNKKFIPPENKGFQLLSKMGWKGGSVGKKVQNTSEDGSKSNIDERSHTDILDEVLSRQGVRKLKLASNPIVAPTDRLSSLTFGDMSEKELQVLVNELLNTYKKCTRLQMMAPSIKSAEFQLQPAKVKEFSDVTNDIVKRLSEPDTVSSSEINEKAFLTRADICDIKQGLTIPYYFDTIVFDTDISKRERQIIHNVAERCTMRGKSYGIEPNRYLTIAPFKRVKELMQLLTHEILTPTSTKISSVHKNNGDTFINKQNITTKDYATIVKIPKALEEGQLSKKAQRRLKQKMRLKGVKDDFCLSIKIPQTHFPQLFAPANMAKVFDGDDETFLDHLLVPLTTSADFLEDPQFYKQFANFYDTAFESPWDCLCPQAFSIKFEDSVLLVLQNNFSSTSWYKNHEFFSLFFRRFFVISSKYLSPYWDPYSIMKRNQINQLQKDIRSLPTDPTTKEATIDAGHICIAKFSVSNSDKLFAKTEELDAFLVRICAIQAMVRVAHCLPYIILEKPIDNTRSNNIAELLDQETYYQLAQSILPFGIELDRIPNQDFLECMYRSLPPFNVNYCVSLILSAYLRYVRNGYNRKMGCETLIIGNGLSIQLRDMIKQITKELGNKQISVRLLSTTWTCVVPYYSYEKLVNKIIPDILQN